MIVFKLKESCRAGTKAYKQFIRSVERKPDVNVHAKATKVEPNADKNAAKGILRSGARA
jgi:hypothetical protein